MNKNKLYEYRNYGERILWILILIIGYAGIYTKKTIFFSILAFLLVFLGVYFITTLLYFKKSPVLKGVSDKSKISIVGTYIFSALLFYAAYWIFTRIIKHL